MLFLLISAIILISGCQSKETDKSGDVASAPISRLSAELPLLLTSCGQGAEYQIIHLLLENGKIEHTAIPLANIDDLSGVKTLFISVGASSKGLAAENITADEEIERIESLIEHAKQNNILVVSIYPRGSSTKGKLAEQFLSPAFSSVDYAIIDQGSDDEKKILNICNESKVPLMYADGFEELGNILSNAFK